MLGFFVSEIAPLQSASGVGLLLHSGFAEPFGEVLAQIAQLLRTYQRQTEILRSDDVVMAQRAEADQHGARLQAAQ